MADSRPGFGRLGFGAEFRHGGGASRRKNGIKNLRRRVQTAQKYTAALSDDAYGTIIREAITGVVEATRTNDTAPRPTAPGST